MIEKVGAVLASAMLVSGCNQDVIQTLETPSNQTPQISVDSLPNTLPDAVAQQTLNVVAVTDIIPGFLTNILGYCSGVRIDQYDYLSAGHCDLQLTDHQSAYCENIAISSPSTYSVSGESLPATRKVDVYSGSPSGVSNIAINNLKEDTLLIETATEPRPYTNPTHYADSSSEITVGEPLYVANYEPTANGDLRSPYTHDLSPDELKTGLNKPAIFGAVTLAQFQNGMIMGISSNKPYSSPSETEVREGSSGGPVYDADGNLIGTIIDLVTSLRTVRDVERSLGVDITGVSGSSDANVFVIQGITPQLISDLQSQQQPAPGC